MCIINCTTNKETFKNLIILDFEFLKLFKKPPKPRFFEPIFDPPWF